MVTDEASPGVGNKSRHSSKTSLHSCATSSEWMCVEGSVESDTRLGRQSKKEHDVSMKSLGRRVQPSRDCQKLQIISNQIFFFAKDTPFRACICTRFGVLNNVGLLQTITGFWFYLPHGHFNAFTKKHPHQNIHKCSSVLIQIIR